MLYFLLKYHLRSNPEPAAISPIMTIKLYSDVCLNAISILMIIVAIIITIPIIVTILPINDFGLKNITIIPTINGTSIIKCFKVKRVIIDNIELNDVIFGISNEYFNIDVDVILNNKIWEE